MINTDVISELAKTAMNLLMERHYVNAEYIICGMKAYIYSSSNDCCLRTLCCSEFYFELPRDKTKTMQYLDNIISYCEALSLV